ncbi:MAG: D-alanyl-D-alanine carboxypeptidase family protein [Candidatus Saccharibacteria bacterium]|nr:D-alanyl-D-alanine carboxypeptidase family protein [Candidatus Saccharibacteria bacterium]
MKVRKFLYSGLLVLVASIFAAQPTIALSKLQLEQFTNNNIMFYNPGDTDDFNLLMGCYGTAAQTVSDAERAGFVWNYFVNANITDVSDHAEVIAGIIGNLQAESGQNLDPFAFGDFPSGKVYGIFQAKNEKFREDVEKKFGSHWGKSGELSEETIREAITYELDYLVSADYNWNHSQFVQHIGKLNNYVGVEGAKAYAELFLVFVERAFAGNQALENPEVQAYAYEDIYYEGTVARRNYAENIFKKYAGSSPANSCYDKISGNKVIIIGDSTVSSGNFSALSGVDLYVQDGKKIKEDQENNKSAYTILSELKNNNNLREYVTLAFSSEAYENITSEELSSVLNLSSSGITYIISPYGLETDKQALLKSKADSDNNIRLIPINEQSTDVAQVIVDTYNTESVHPTYNPIYLEATQPISPFNKNSEDIPCATGTSYAKIIQNGQEQTSYKGAYYAKDTPFDGGLTLCSITGFSGNAMSNLGGETISNYGNIVVNSRASGAFYSLTQNMKELGISLSASESFRTHAKQERLYKCRPGGEWVNESKCDGWRRSDGWIDPAAPGSSDHEKGYAVDFDIDSITTTVNKLLRDSTSKLSQYVKSQGYDLYNHNTCDSLGSQSQLKDRKDNGVGGFGRWGTTGVQFLCYELKKYGLALTVYYEPWHIAVKR